MSLGTKMFYISICRIKETQQRRRVRQRLLISCYVRCVPNVFILFLIEKNIQGSARRTHCATTVIYGAPTLAPFTTSRYTFLCVKGQFFNVLSVRTKCLLVISMIDVRDIMLDVQEGYVNSAKKF